MVRRHNIGGPPLKLLLASAGITNASIRAALIGLLGKPIADSTALCIPTASYGMGRGGRSPPAVHRRPGARLPDDRAGLEVGGRPGADRAGEPRPGPVGANCPRGGCPARQRRRPDVPAPLDGPIGARAAPALSVGHGVRRAQRREHGPDAADRRGLRRVAGDCADDRASTRPWASSTSRSSRTSTIRTCRTTRWQTPSAGPPGIPVPAYAIDDQTAIAVTDDGSR